MKQRPRNHPPPPVMRTLLRPRTGGAMRDETTASKPATASGHANIAAPGDGRTPATPPVSYIPFEGIVLTDTFQLSEGKGTFDDPNFQVNSERATKQNKRDIRVIMGSQIINEPNDWAREHNDPKYILNLLKSIITVSLETMEIVNALPALKERKS
jgi:predicted helicase